MDGMVKNWIDSNFDANTVTVDPTVLLPGGHRVVDRDGDEILVYYDILTSRVKWVELDVC